MDLRFSPDMVDAIKVKFLKPIFEDDFPEKGMTAWLTDVEWDEKMSCYKLYFDFTEFEAENDKYFKECYYPNIHTAGLPQKKNYTAKEAGMYSPKYSVYFSVESSLDKRSDIGFSEEISDYLRVIE